jgi:glycosyltransferase involved in cell wall biosynthesis
MKHSISVVCPAWQAASTLSDTLASVRAQILPPDEILVVNDGSTDDTAKIARAAGATVISRSHSGVAAALNTGIAASRGSLLAFIDADDLWPADKLAAQTRLLASDCNIAGVLGLMQLFISPAIEPEAESRYRMPDDLQKAWVTGALLVHRGVFDAVGGFDEAIHAGFHVDWFDRGRRLGFDFAIPRRVVLLRRIAAGTLSHRSSLRDAGYALMARRAIQRRRASQRRE